MNQAVNPSEIDERAEVDDRGHDTLADGTLGELVEEFRANFALGLLEPRATREHHVVAVAVQLDDLGLDLLADVRLQIADATHLDQRRGQEAAQTDVQNQAALDDLDDGALDGLVLLLELLDRAPRPLVLSAFLGQDQATFFVFLGENQGLDLVAHGNDLVGVDIVLDREFAGRDDTFGLVTDVKKNFVAVNLDDGPSTMSPSLKYLIVLSIAARKSSAEPMSLTATCGEVTVGLGMCGVAPDRLCSRDSAGCS